VKRGLARSPKAMSIIPVGRGVRHGEFTVLRLITYIPGEWHCIMLAQKLANYFLNRLPKNAVCYWDLDFTAGPEERDSSAAAIAACGLLELPKQLPLVDEYRNYYENAALRIMASLAGHYTTHAASSNGILLHVPFFPPPRAPRLRVRLLHLFK
jgi:hypothetical protein